MSSWWGLIRKLRSLIKRGRAEDDLTDELQAHIELQTRKYVEQGMRVNDAKRLARVEFGSLENTREECRDVDRWVTFDGIARNLKFATRSLCLTPGFSLSAVCILAVGIGSTLAVFNLLDALMLRPLPVHNAAELVRISSVPREGDFGALPTTILEGLRQIPDYRGICGFDTSYSGVEVQGSITSVGTLGFTGDCFSTLGIGVQLGRGLTNEDDELGSEPVAVITDAFWRSEFHAQRDVLGRRIRLGGRTYTIVGVTEPGFNGLLVGFSERLIVASRQQYMEVMPNGKLPAYWWVNILARRAPGISLQQAAARMKVRAQGLLRQSIPPHYSQERQANYLATKIAATPGSGGVDYFLGRRFGSSLYAAAGICAAILLIGCANLINLLLARSLKRRHEIGIRYALGAKWSQLAGLFAAESVLLVIPGAGFALLLARAIDVWLVAQGASMFGNLDLGIVFDWRAGVQIAIVAVSVMIAFTSASVWQANQMRDSNALKEGGRGMAGYTPAVQKILIGAQIALTLALVAGSDLLAASLAHLYNLDFGVKVSNVWDAMLSTRPGEKPYFDRGSYYQEMLAEIREIPGVEAATLTDFIPFYTLPEEEVVAAVDTGKPGDELHGTVLTTSADFFKTVGLKRIAGQEFQERGDGEPAAVVSESLTARLTANPQNLIGHHIRLGTDSRYQRVRITGVVSNAQMNLAHPEELAPLTVYLNMWQHPDRQGYPVLLIKTASNHLNVEALRKIVNSHGREYVDRVRTISEEKDGALMENKLLAYLSEAFSGLALAMAATGLFGVLSYYVASRTNEIGLRMALGAKRLQIQWMVVGQVARVLVIGIGAGLLCSFVVARTIRNLLFGVRGNDPIPVVLACAVLGLTCLCAAWLPARRASRVDPILALRHD